MALCDFYLLNGFLSRNDSLSSCLALVLGAKVECDNYRKHSHELVGGYCTTNGKISEYAGEDEGDDALNAEQFCQLFFHFELPP